MADGSGHDGSSWTRLHAGSSSVDADHTPELAATDPARISTASLNASSQLAAMGPAGSSSTSLFTTSSGPQDHVAGRRILKRSHMQDLPPLIIQPHGRATGGGPLTGSGLSSAQLTASFPMPPATTPKSSAGSLTASSLMRRGDLDGSDDESGPTYSHRGMIPKPSAPPASPASTDMSRFSLAYMADYGLPRPNSVYSMLSHNRHDITYPPTAHQRGSTAHPSALLRRTSSSNKGKQYSLILESSDQRHSMQAELASGGASTPASTPGLLSSNPVSPMRSPVSHTVHLPVPVPRSPYLLSPNELKALDIPLPPSPFSEPSYVRRNDRHRESTNTFDTSFTSNSIGMTAAIDTLEGFNFATNSAPSAATHTRSHSLQSVTSSVGYTHELQRNGSMLIAQPRVSYKQGRQAVNVNPDGSRFARASLVSSQLLSATPSMDPLNQRAHSAPPAPSLPDDTQYPAQPDGAGGTLSPPRPVPPDVPYDGVLDTDAPLARHPSFSSTVHSSSLYHWRKQNRRAKASKSAHSRTSTHFTLDSRAGPSPSLYHNPYYVAQAVQKELALPMRHLMKRANILSRMLEDPVALEQYEQRMQQSSSHHKPKPRRRTHKTGNSMPMMWSSTMSARGLSSGVLTRPIETEIPVIKPVRRRKSYPNAEVKSMIGSTDLDPPLPDRSSFSTVAASSIPPKRRSCWPRRKRHRILLLAALLAVITIAAGVGVGVKFAHQGSVAASCNRTCLNGGTATIRDDVCVCTCKDLFTGTFCQLDGTCHPLRSDNGTELLVASGIVSLASAASALFTPRLNDAALATPIVRALPASSQTDCRVQAQLVDTSNLDPKRYPSRSRWAAAAILWDAAMSSDTSGQVRDFQNKLSYWQWQDEPFPNPQVAYQQRRPMYTLDFGTMSVEANRNASEVAV